MTTSTDIQKDNTIGNGLCFSDVCVRIGEKEILRHVSGHATRGQMLAVMGPSGSGKTTLLNTLGSQQDLHGGSVTMDGQLLSKKLKRRISYVLQQDIFFPNLTLRETLWYSALIRLPSDSYTFKEKLEKVEEIIKKLNLQDCAGTLIGDALQRGLSGGEKKRANIGSELLTDPSLLLLDEPTSGLDSSSALSLLKVIKSIAEDDNKIVVASIHQPSSQMYHMFDSLLLLTKGKVVYYGPASEAMDYFANIGFPCTLHYNPADFIIELVSDGETRQKLVGEDPAESGSTLLPVRQRLWNWVRFWRRMRRTISHPDKPPSVEEESQVSATNPLYDVQGNSLPNSKHSTAADMQNSSSLKAVSCPNGTLATSGPGQQRTRECKWPTPWYWQFLVLLARSFRQSRHILLSKMVVLRTVLIALMLGLVWFRLPRDNIDDRFGFLFFIIMYWGFTPMFESIFTFPPERVILRKERATGSYHLSAYYLAKTLSELPLMFSLCSLFLMISYWLSWINGIVAFLTTWGVLLLHATVSQSYGILVGATIMDLQKSLVLAAVVMLSFVVVAGYFTERLPFWLFWLKYLSFLLYTFQAFMQIEFGSDRSFLCTSASSHPACYNCSLTDAGSNATISGGEVLSELDISIPLYGNVLVLVGHTIVLRLLAYLALRFLNRK